MQLVIGAPFGAYLLVSLSHMHTINTPKSVLEVKGSCIIYNQICKASVNILLICRAMPWTHFSIGDKIRSQRQLQTHPKAQSELIHTHHEKHASYFLNRCYSQNSQLSDASDNAVPYFYSQKHLTNAITTTSSAMRHCFCHSFVLDLQVC